jgi:hypothetical protein
LDAARVMNLVRSLFDQSAYEQVLPTLRENWILILRDPCSRTNSALVRPGSVDFFVNKAFE